MSAVPRPRKPYVNRETSRHGKTVWYFRRGDGPRIRLHGDYESPEWLADYEAALGGQARPAPAGNTKDATLRWLVERYYLSVDWANAAAATKAQRKSIFTRMLVTSGSWRLAEITKTDIVEGRDLRSATPAAAVCFVKAVRALFRWAVEAEYVAADPTEGVKATDPKTDGHHTWTAAEVERFCKFYPRGTRERLTLDVLLLTGMRASDAVLFGRQHIRDGVIEYRSVKTGIDVVIPLLPDLEASIAATAPKTEMTILVTEFGRAFSSVNSFGNWFRKRCIAAGVPGRAHGLRKAGATIAAENGASDRELMAMWGWETEKEATLYTRKADRIRLAKAAAEKLRLGTSYPRTFDPVRDSRQKA